MKAKKRSGTRLTLVGTGIAAAHASGESRRYNLANPSLDAFLAAHPVLGSEVETTCFDVPFSLDSPSHPADVLDRVVASRPDVLGLSCYAWDMEAHLDLAARVRAELPETRVVLGGPSATYHTQRLLQRHPVVDAAVRGEGEETFADLLLADWTDLSGVAGVTWRAPDGTVREERARERLSDLSTLRSPILDGKVVPPKENLLLEFSRGCIYKCKHCAWQTLGSKIRTVPAERVTREIAWAREHGYEHALIIDSSINNEDAWLKELSQAIAKGNPDGRALISYFANYRMVRPEQMKWLKAIHTHEILVGLESVNAEALKATGRKPQIEDEFSRATDLLASEVGPVTPNMMFGMPGDDLEGFRKTLDYVAALAERPGPQRIRHARIHWAIIPPGSYFSEHADAYGIQVHPTGVPYVLGTSKFPPDDLRRGLHLIANHPRSDLFAWEDAEPLRILGGDIPDMLAPWVGRLGSPAPKRITDEEVLAAIRPLVPGRPMPRGWHVGAIERAHGVPVVVFQGPDGRDMKTQLRMRDTDPRPLARTLSYDIVSMGAPANEGEKEMQRALVELIARNDPKGSEPPKWL